MLRRGSCIGCFVFARKIRRFLVETANDKRILFFCLLDGVNLKAFYGFISVFLGSFWEECTAASQNPLIFQAQRTA
uniref:hypothetical protein n=1 Tax=Gemmiger formicilis TaxID=745368 RepID=UPI003FEE3516